MSGYSLHAPWSCAGRCWEHLCRLQPGYPEVLVHPGMAPKGTHWMSWSWTPSHVKKAWRIFEQSYHNPESATNKWYWKVKSTSICGWNLASTLRHRPAEWAGYQPWCPYSAPQWESLDWWRCWMSMSSPSWMSVYGLDFVMACRKGSKSINSRCKWQFQDGCPTLISNIHTHWPHYQAGSKQINFSD